MWENWKTYTGVLREILQLYLHFAYKKTLDGN